MAACFHCKPRVAINAFRVGAQRRAVAPIMVDVEIDARNARLPQPEDATPTFEAGLQQLEAIVKEMESGELPLERALELFEHGMKLSDACRKQLEEAETRVEILIRRAGEMQPQPFRN